MIDVSHTHLGNQAEELLKAATLFTKSNISNDLIKIDWY